MDEHVDRAPAVSAKEQLDLFQHKPMYRVRLVRERDVPFEDQYKVSCPADVASFLQAYYEDKAREEVIVLLLSTANAIIGIAPVSEGGLAASVFEPRSIFQPALLANAAAVVIAHNHPSGNPEPSREDVRMTEQAAEAGRMLGIPVHDHLIIAGRQHTSLAERGVI